MNNYLIIITLFAFLLMYKKNIFENFYFEKRKKYKHKKFFKTILKNEKKLKSKKKAELIIKPAFHLKDFINENCNSVITGNIDILKFDLKDSLWFILSRKYGLKKTIDITPESRIIAQDNISKFIEENKNNSFILKKNVENGKGLFISNNKKELLSTIKSSNKTKIPYVVIQKIIMNPLLIENKTFKIRLYLVVTCKNQQIKFHISKHGYLGYSKDNWNPNKITFENTMASPHWNEYYLEKDPKKYNHRYNKLINQFKNKPIFLEDFKKYIETKGIPFYRLWNEIKRKIFLIMDSFVLNNKYESFNISGIDIIFDNKYNPYIIEFNKSPGVSPYHFIKKQQEREIEEKTNIYNDALSIMFPNKFKNKNTLERLDAFMNY